MVGTNCGGKQYRRALPIAWTGSAIVGAACELIGSAVALLPNLWMELFTRDPDIIRAGAGHLRVVGPIYGWYDLAMALYFATQGFGSVLWAVTSGAVLRAGKSLPQT